MHTEKFLAGRMEKVPREYVFPRFTGKKKEKKKLILILIMIGTLSSSL